MRICTSLATVTIAVGAIACIGCGKEQSTKAATVVQSAPVRIAAITVRAEPLAPVVSITGTMVSRSTVTVKAETTGRVLRFQKEEGDRVNGGEPVAWIDDSHEKIAARQAQTAVLVAEAALERAKVAQRHASAEWTRAQNLLNSGGITDRDHKAAELADRDAVAQLAVAAAQLEQARAQVAAAKQMLDDSVVRAPVAGEIQAKLISEGGYVEPPTPVFLLVDNTRLELESMVATANLGSIRPGQQVKFAVNAFPAEEFTGRVIEVNPAVDAETRSAKVRVRIDNRVGKLKAGMFAQGEIATGATRDGILLPSSAINRDDRSTKSAFVLVIENGRAVKRQISLGFERDAVVEVTEGLRPGEVVALEQSIEVTEGVTVSPEMREGK